jgi:CHASE2 domain-containing sensor protein
VPRMIALLVALLLTAGPAAGAVQFADWSENDMETMLAEAAAADRLVMVVITQPDWCPRMHRAGPRVAQESRGR